MINFNDFISKYLVYNVSEDKLIKGIEALAPIFSVIQIEDNDEFIKPLKKFHEHICGCHFNEYFAKEQVNNMYHTKPNGTICAGEVYNIDYAKMIYDNHVRNIDNNITVWDVYVALNAQYHDHVNEYKKWFGNLDENKLDAKIANATITFWFEDEDAGGGKVWNYFKNIG